MRCVRIVEECIYIILYAGPRPYTVFGYKRLVFVLGYTAGPCGRVQYLVCEGFRVYLGGGMWQ